MQQDDSGSTSDQSSTPWKGKTVAAGAGLVALSAMLAWTHAAPSDAGISAADLEAFESADDADALRTAFVEAEAAGVATGNLLLDLVEPEDGEGGSEAAIAALVGEIDAAAATDAEFAGFYAESEHLIRVEGDTKSLLALGQRLAGNELVEGMEPEIVYSLPTDALVAVPPADLDDDDPEAQKPRAPRFTPNDPMYPLQWHMDKLKAPEAWTKTRGDGAIIAVIDTGVAWKDLSWQGINAKAVPDLAGIEFVGGETFLDKALPDGLDDHAHGTHVAGTIAQATDNGVGVAGVAHHAKIMPLKVLSGDGRGSVAAIANAIRYAADHDAHVINMSLGGPIPSRAMAKAVEYAHNKGTTVICAAGNEKRSRVSYPAAYEHSVAVAATDFDGKRTFYSNWGKALDVSAPGGDMRADRNGDGYPDGVLQNTIMIQDPERNDYLWFQGTSMASPHAAGVAGLIVAQGVTNPKEVERIMKATAVHPSGKDWDRDYGAGNLDANAAVDAAARGKYLPERGGFALLLGLLGLAGLGGASMQGNARRRNLIAGGGLALGAAAAVGVFGTPLAYGLAGMFGAAALGPALLLSAAAPLLATLLLFQVKPLRGLLAGLSLGWSAVLLHGAIVLPTLLTTVPGGPAIDRLFLLANAGVALLLAHLISKR